MVGLLDRVRARLGGTQAVATVPAVAAPHVLRPQARYLRDTSSGILSMRRAVTRDGWREVWEAGDRAYALALDFLHNSGWISGAANQIIVDTIGTELKLNARPDLSRLGYDEEERASWCRLVEAEWRRHAWTPGECDLAGKSTVAEMLDGVMRYYLAGGEAFAVLDYLSPAQRAAYGIRTGTKFSLVAPHRLVRTTREMEGLYQGIFQDANGRPTHYRFKKRIDGMEREEDVPARDAVGLARVIHAMDRGENPDSPRGISPLAPILKVIAQSDQLADATLATALMQTLFAATIQSPEPSEQAFKAIQTLADTDAMPMPPDFPGGQAAWGTYLSDLACDLMDVWGQRVDALKKGGINLSEQARIGHLGPGEKLEFHTAQTPGGNYLPFSQDMRREMARQLGVTFESLSMDNSNASYSSVRVGVATIWPLAVRRRERLPAPVAQGIYEAWLDESIAEGRIPFKGGYRAFAANRDRVVWAEWQGPAKPSADDYKSAMAAKVRLETGISSLADECAELGRDWEETTTQRAREQQVLTDAGLPIPFQRATGGAGPNGMAADGNREPAQ